MKRLINRISTVAIFAIVGLYLITGVGNMVYADSETQGGSASTHEANWSNVDSVFASDDKRAVYNNTTQDIMRIYNFGFSIPTANTIDSMEMYCEGNGTDSKNKTIHVSFSISGYTDYGAVRSIILQWITDGTTNPVQVPDLWDTTWTATQINSNDFGVLVRDADVAAAALNIDYLYVTVWHTAPVISVDTVTCVDTTYSSVKIRAVLSGYGATIDSTILLLDTSNPPTTHADKNVSVTSPDTLDGTGLGGSTKHFYKVIGWDEAVADTSAVDSLTTDIYPAPDSLRTTTWQSDFEDTSNTGYGNPDTLDPVQLVTWIPKFGFESTFDSTSLYEMVITTDSSGITDTLWWSDTTAFASNYGDGDRTAKIVFPDTAGTRIQAGIQYFWKIRAFGKDTIASAWSTWQSFKGLQPSEWWDSDYKYRYQITWESPHDYIFASTPMKIEIPSGLGEIIATNCNPNQGVVYDQMTTFGGFTYAFWQGVNEDYEQMIYAKKRNDSTGVWGDSVVVGRPKTGEIHYGPTIIVGPDSVLHVFQSGHQNESWYIRTDSCHVTGSGIDITNWRGGMGKSTADTTIQAGNGDSIFVDNTKEWTDDELIGWNFRIYAGKGKLGGDGNYQYRTIAGNSDTSLFFTESWDSLPDTTSKYQIIYIIPEPKLSTYPMPANYGDSSIFVVMRDAVYDAPYYSSVVDSGQAKGAQTNSTLVDTSSDCPIQWDDQYKGWMIEIKAGTGTGQQRYLSGNNDSIYFLASNQVAAESLWTTNPDETSYYWLFYGHKNCQYIRLNTNKLRIDSAWTGRRNIIMYNDVAEWGNLGPSIYHGLYSKGDTSRVHLTATLWDKYGMGGEQGGRAIVYLNSKPNASLELQYWLAASGDTIGQMQTDFYHHPDSTINYEAFGDSNIVMHRDNPNYDSLDGMKLGAQGYGDVVADANNNPFVVCYRGIGGNTFSESQWIICRWDTLRGEWDRYNQSGYSLFKASAKGDHDAYTVQIDTSGSWNKRRVIISDGASNTDTFDNISTSVEMRDSIRTTDYMDIYSLGIYLPDTMAAANLTGGAFNNYSYLDIPCVDSVRLWNYRCGGNIVLDNQTLYGYGYYRPSKNDSLKYFGGEVLRGVGSNLYSKDMSWGRVGLSKNSAYGAGRFNLSNWIGQGEPRQMLYCAWSDLVYNQDRDMPYQTMNSITGDDVRIVYGVRNADGSVVSWTERDRIPADRVGMSNSKWWFTLSTVIPADQVYFYDSYVVMAYSKNKTPSTPPTNLANLFKLYESFELMADSSNLDNQSYWNVSGDSARIHSYNVYGENTMLRSGAHYAQLFNATAARDLYLTAVSANSHVEACIYNASCELEGDTQEMKKIRNTGTYVEYYIHPDSGWQTSTVKKTAYMGRVEFNLLDTLASGRIKVVGLYNSDTVFVDDEDTLLSDNNNASTYSDRVAPTTYSPMVVDEFECHWVKILSGTYSGEVRQADSNSTTYIYISPDFSGIIGQGVAFAVFDSNAGISVNADSLKFYSSGQGYFDGIMCYKQPENIPVLELSDPAITSAMGRRRPLLLKTR